MNAIIKLVESIENYNDDDLCIGTLITLKKIKDEAHTLEIKLAERDKLVEQMRETLEMVKSHMHKTNDFYALDDVNAALSAAERIKAQWN